MEKSDEEMQRIAGGDLYAEAFPPLAAKGARVLILGSMPSVESLRSGQYYGHPRNHFWPLVFTIFGAQLPDRYTERTRFLVDRGIAVWDVLAGCRRKGSLDSAIRDEKYNDFTVFLGQYPCIHTIFCNGRKAESSLYRLMRSDPEDKALLLERRIELLPSSSPVPTRTMRRMEDKLPAWAKIREALAGEKV